MSRPSHHPPEPSPYTPPQGHEPGFILGAHGGVVGFGRAGFYVAAIPSADARTAIIKHHYSHRVVNNSYVHVGVYYRDNFAGVLSLGYALNPARADKVVAGSAQGDYLELNRMWLADACPRNSESQALSYTFKYLRRACPSVAWVQSFADERCGRLGVVYQAANFLFVGSHLTDFLFLDGEYYHPMLLTAHKKSGERGRAIRAGLDRAIRLRFRQFRYVYFLKQPWRKRLRLPIQPYPKPQQTA